MVKVYADDFMSLVILVSQEQLRHVASAQEANGEPFNCPVKALTRRVLHLWEHNAVGKTLLSAFSI